MHKHRSRKGVGRIRGNPLVSKKKFVKQEGYTVLVRRYVNGEYREEIVTLPSWSRRP